MMATATRHVAVALLHVISRIPFAPFRRPVARHPPRAMRGKRINIFFSYMCARTNVTSTRPFSRGARQSAKYYGRATRQDDTSRLLVFFNFLKHMFSRALQVMFL